MKERGETRDQLGIPLNPPLLSPPSRLVSWADSSRGRKFESVGALDWEVPGEVLSEFDTRSPT